MAAEKLPLVLDALHLRSAGEAVTTALRDAILSGQLKPGTRLRQEETAAQLQVSRIPLRDALRQLATEGLVRIDARRGAYVASLTADDVREVFTLRLLLEPPCIAASIRRLDPESLTRLDALLDAMEVRQPPAAAFAARREFYFELYKLSGMPRMVEIIMRLRDDVHRYHVITNTGRSRLDHDTLREQLHAGDAVGAAKLLRSHLSAAEHDLAAILEREQRETLSDPDEL
jgi:DNA-binding GntR family transcriptional regulator